MKRENYVAPSIKVLELSSELMQNVAESSSLPLSQGTGTPGIIGAKENGNKWSDEEDNAPSNAWEE